VNICVALPTRQNASKSGILHPKNKFKTSD